MIRFMLDDRPVEGLPDESILQVAQRHGVVLPHLCYTAGLGPDGSCRACVVEIEGERVLAPSCCRSPKPDMTVRTTSVRAESARRGVLELLQAEAPAARGELAQWAKRAGARAGHFDVASREHRTARDASHPAITFDADACITCTRCVRACREVQANDVIGLAARGGIAFDAGVAMGESSCVACGECVAACPTGALSSKTVPVAVERQVDSLCPYCGVGCQLTYAVAGAVIIRVDGRNGPANDGRLCVKGRYGFDYLHHAGRLTRPLIRRDGVPKDPALCGSVDDWRAQFREASWDEALAVAADGLKRIRDTDGPQALAGFGSAKGSNEEAYLFQKLVRLGFGTHNVDHCTRLCHASSVAALLEGIGSGAVSNPVRDVEHADFIIVIGANPAANHPVAGSFIKNAARRGATLVVMDPRVTELARDATYSLQFAADADVLLLNALLHVIVFEGLVNEAFVGARVDGYDDAFRAGLAAYAPEAVAERVGIDAATLRTVARGYATAKAAMIFWGMGVSQHTHGTDNVRCLIAMALLTGQIGRSGTGLHPLRGQNNVQGASDAGLIPMMLPDYQRVADPEVRARFERLWGAPLSPVPGLTVTEIIDAAAAGTIRGMYILGENPAMSDPDLAHARAALARLDHLVVQDLFLTETAAFADVILPASGFAEKTGSFTNTDRYVQLGRAAIAPPGEARQDLAIIEAMARRLGLDWHYGGPAAVFAEMRAAMPSLGGISWARLERDGAVAYPCDDEQDPGQPVIFIERFPTPNGRGRIVPVAYRPAAETPDPDYPWVLITGRQLEHWHTGSMTRRAGVLDVLEPSPYINLHPDDLAELKLAEGDRVTLRSRRGELTAEARADAGLPRHAVFMPFCYAEAAANLLTNSAIDPVGKIPEVKFCAVQVVAVEG